MPRVHDCIAILLGSVERYEAEMNACAGTYYITPGWAKYGTTTYSAYMTEYLPKYGEEDARYIAEECLKHYTRIAFIDQGVGDVEVGRAHAREFAATFGKRYEEIPGISSIFAVWSWPVGRERLSHDSTRIRHRASTLPGLHSISLP